jgi:hypothetical protein
MVGSRRCAAFVVAVLTVSFDGHKGEEIQIGSSRLHALIATVVTMNSEPWRDTDYNFVEKRSTFYNLRYVTLALPQR